MPILSGSGFPATAGLRVYNTINQLPLRTPVLNVFKVHLHPMREFRKYLTWINIVLIFNHLQPLNPEPRTDYPK
jgi:hypothetical protein